MKASHALSHADHLEARNRRFGVATPQALLAAPAAGIDLRRHDGVDVSRYQLDINWDTVAKHLRTNTPEPFAACKATEGRSYVDPTLVRNRAGMAAAHLPLRFLYHWLSPAPLLTRALASARKASAEQQAAHLLKTIGLLLPGEGIMLDAEQDGITEDQCLSFCQYIEARTGRPVAVYTGRYVAAGTIWNSARIYDGHRARVFAAYTTSARAVALAMPHGWDVWQWTGSGTVPGVGPLIDINSVASTTRLRSACYPPAPTPEPAPQEKNMDLIAYAYDGDTAGALYVSNGVTSRWVPNTTALKALIWSSTAQGHPLRDVNGKPLVGYSAVVRIPATQAGAFGEVVGTDAPPPAGKTRDRFGCPH